MKLKSSRALALFTTLACAAASAQEEAPVPPLPIDALSNQPHFTEQINQRFEARDGAAPVSGINGFEIGEPAPTFRTLQEAAQAGVNPLSQAGVQYTLPPITSETPKASKPIWPALFGGLSLLACGFVLFVNALVSRRQSTLDEE